MVQIESGVNCRTYGLGDRLPAILSNVEVLLTQTCSCISFFVTIHGLAARRSVVVELREFRDTVALVCPD